MAKSSGFYTIGSIVLAGAIPIMGFFGQVGFGVLLLRRGEIGNSPGTVAQAADASGECWNLKDSTTMTTEQIRAYLQKKGAPDYIIATAADISAAATQMNINPALMIAVNGKESTFGRFGRAVVNKNPGNVKWRSSNKLVKETGIRITGNDDQGHSIFPDWKEGWKGQALMLYSFLYTRKYPNGQMGANSIYEINAGPDLKVEDHANGYAESSDWYKGVRQFMGEMLPCATTPVS